MLWSSVLLLFFGSLAAADYGWNTGYQYVYNIEARTVAGLHQVADQYSGNVIHGKLNVYAESDNKLTLQVVEAKYADFNQPMSEGWTTDLQQSKLNYKSFPIKNDIFQIHLKDGVVEKLVVDKDTLHWELNFMKAIGSQFQVDVQGQNLKKSRKNNLPTGQKQTGIYKTMEDSVSGEYETIYEISLMPEYLLQSQPSLAPLPHLSSEGDIINVVKTRNFSSSRLHPVYHYGFNGHEGWKAGTNQMGNFLSRTSQSRIVLSGKLNKYTIQSSVTTEKVLVAPHLYNSQKGIVGSRMNLTLEECNNFKGSVPTINSPKTVNNLVYEYEHGIPQSSDSDEDSSFSSSSSSESSSSEDSSDSSSSSSQENNWNQGLKRKTRSATTPSQSSSSSSQSSSSSSSSEEGRNNPIRQGASSSSSSSSSSEEDNLNEGLKRKTRSTNPSKSSSSSSQSSSSSSSSEEGRNNPIRQGASSSSSSSSSSEEDNLNEGLKRKTRSTNPSKYSSSSSQSSSSSSSSEEGRNNPIRQGASSSSSSSSSSESSSISSSEEYLPTPPLMNEVPKIEFSPDNMVNQNSENGQTVEYIVRVARQIGKFLQNPSNIPKDGVLTYYSFLSRLIAATMYQHLEQATEKLYFSKEKIQGSANQESYQHLRSWQAYRDAVAEAGTGPALVTIFSWIKSGKIREEEAAQVVAVLSKSARVPTTEYVNYFFEMVKSSQVRNQKYLNVSALLSFTDLSRRSQVDVKSAQQRYPVHLTEAKALKRLAVVIEQYIPYLQAHLRDAVQRGDSIQIQVYIRALANIGHPNIWVGLEPYLEGKYPVSEFQRLVMIAYLGDMIRVHPNTARSILYRIYQNEGEVPAVRVAAVMQLMKTNPPAQMIQRMAEQTNYDHSEHVNAAVKSAIESAANGEYYIHPELIKNARSAANLLTTKNYGFQYSQNFIKSYIAKQQNTLEYQHYLTYIQSLDGIYPSSVLYELQRKIGGYVHEPQTMSFMSSSSEELLNLLFGQLGLGSHHNKTRRKHGMAQQKQGQQSKYSYQKINEILDGQYDAPVQVEGNFFFSFLGAPRFFAFDNHTIEQLPQLLQQVHQKLQKGVNFHETKFYNQYSVEVGFPLATGVPFIYSYDEPTLFFADVQAKGRLQREQGKNEHYQVPYNASTEGIYKFAWSSQKKGKLGFVSPYSGQKHLAVVEKKTQIYVPFEGQLLLNGPQQFFQASIQPYSSESNEQQKIFQHSTDVYTTYHGLYDIKPELQGSNARPVHVASSQQFKKSFGEAITGYAFQIKGESENNFSDYLRIFKALKTLDYDFISSAFYNDFFHTMANNYYAFSYDPRHSSPEKVVVRLYYDNVEQEGHHQKNSKVVSARDKRIKIPASNLAQPSSVDSRVEELLANAYSGIQDAKAQIFDASVSFEGSLKKGQYAFTLAHAESPVSEKSRYLAYFSASPYDDSQDVKAFKISYQADFKDAQISVFNYKKAFDSDPTSYVEGQIDLSDNDGNHGKIVFEGKFEQTEERKNFVKHSPYTALCQKQMQQNNYIQPACLNASLRANVLDKYELTFKYENVPEEIQQLTSASYGLARHLGYHYNNEQYAGVKNLHEQMKVGLRFSEDLSYFNFSLTSPHFNSQFGNIGFRPQLRPFFLKYPAFNQLHFYSPRYFNTKHYATCAVDSNLVTTFNNRSYPIKFGDDYYVLAHTIPEEYQDSSEESSEVYSYYLRDFTIIAKEYASHQREIQVFLGDDQISMRPSGSDGVTVVANEEMLVLSENKVSRWKNGENQLKAYALPGGDNAVLYFKNHGLEIYYDGRRVALSVSNHHRNQVRGICGTFDGEPANDFTTPSNCVMKEPQQFAASYGVPEEFYRGTVKDDKRQAQNAASCYPREVVYGDVVSDTDAVRGRRLSTMHENDIQASRPKTSPCSSYKIHIVKEGGKSCFSLRPQVSCNPNCKPTKHIEKYIDFHCSPDSDNLTSHWLRMVKEGANPDLSQRTPKSKKRIILPESCISS